VLGAAHVAHLCRLGVLAHRLVEQLVAARRRKLLDAHADLHGEAAEEGLVQCS